MHTNHTFLIMHKYTHALAIVIVHRHIKWNPFKRERKKKTTGEKNKTNIFLNVIVLMRTQIFIACIFNGLAFVSVCQSYRHIFGTIAYFVARTTAKIHRVFCHYSNRSIQYLDCVLKMHSWRFIHFIRMCMASAIVHMFCPIISAEKPQFYGSQLLKDNEFKFS